MKRETLTTILFLCAGCLALQGTRLEAFALLGPYEAWMTTSNCFRLPFSLPFPVPDEKPGDIGGPMCLSNGYRWNVPVVTYGFDQSFVEFFGSNGVAAVEEAIQILNSLPPASSAVLTNYPDDSQSINYQAQAESLYDLQSVTLSLLLEQLGLASPTRSAYVLQSWSNDSGGGAVYNVVMRNYDPVTLSPTADVNGFLYQYGIWSGASIGLDETGALPTTYELPGGQYPAVADNGLGLGGFCTGLTADDVGGLCYLFSVSNVNFETLLPHVSGVGTNANSLVNGALRPGIDKITFMPHSSGSLPWEFLPMTNQYTDTYITNDLITQQQMQRVISQPDFLFCAGDAGKDYPVVLPFARTGTSNWINNAALNANTSGGGPGVIQPPVRITFAKLGQALETTDPDLQDNLYNESVFWGTYDGSNNAPIIYPLPQPGTNELTVRVWVMAFPGLNQSEPSIEFSITGQSGVNVILQTSTNLTNWSPVATNEINGSIFTLFDFQQLNARFYRLVPQ